MKTFKMTSLLVAALVAGSVFSAGCVIGTTAPTPPPTIPYLDISNDTYDALDVYIDGAYMDTMNSAETHTYDLGYQGSHHIMITFKDLPSQVLNDQTLYFTAGTVTSWDVYDNAPVVLVQNNFSYTSGECVAAWVDSVAVPFAIESGSGSTATVTFDSTLCQGETGFYLVDINTHRVQIDGYTTGFPYHDDTRVYLDADHVLFQVP